ncbi:MAG: hypothetical protein RL508_599 [Actinomycetota bacterium]|jgi:NAD+ synthase (glutamine-hydrolysing)
MAPVRLALAQTNPVVGDISGNLDAIFTQVKLAAAERADIVLFGEMALSGYPIEDLAQRASFLETCEKAVQDFAGRLQDSGLGNICVVLGHPAPAPIDAQNGWAIAQNCASILMDGEVIGKYAKHHLPNYSVFDEYRIFVPGSESLNFTVNGLNFAILICEDIWQAGGPVASLKETDTDVALVLNGSPFEVGKYQTRVDLVTQLAKEAGCGVVYVNLVGGQDDLVFDGSSLVADGKGNLVLEVQSFSESRDVIEIESATKIVASSSRKAVTPDDNAQVWNALVVGLRDYVNKNGFPSVILGLSGGIDSAVCAAIAVDAIGASRVFGVSLPSMYSSDHSKSDAFDLAERLGVQIRTEAIAAMVDVTEKQLGLDGVAAENLQARVRGLILMALSNAEGHLTLTTGNKTELAVGYSTIYGDSVGGYAPIKDVPKMLVWQLARWRNEQAIREGKRPPIPENSIEKPPSAELRPGQLDQDSLPEYDLLDRILAAYIDDRLGRDQIIALGIAAETVDRIISLVDRAEWKRRQGAIGPKISGMAFGRDRRMPITNKFKQH